VTNTLAYWDTELIANEKIFIAQAPGFIGTGKQFKIKTKNAF
jgi:hypothetical protein